MGLDSSKPAEVRGKTLREALDKVTAGQVANTWAGGASEGCTRHSWTEGWFGPVGGWRPLALLLKEGSLLL